MKKHTFCLWLFCGIIISATAQNNPSLFIGPGIGFDHGGFGAKLEFQPEKHIGIFAGLGYNLASAGANGGVIFNILPEKRVSPMLTAMYGYNAVIKVQYLDGTDHGVYSGLTAGAGVDFKLGRSEKSKINVSLLVPFRNAGFFNDYNNLRQNGEISQDMLPVAFSVGWNYNLLWKK